MKKAKILFICLGNICRSPTAEAVFNKLTLEKGLSAVLSCESAGTAGYHIGEEPDPRTQAHGRKRGYEFTTLAQQFNPQKDFSRFDLILCLDRNNLSNVQRLDSAGQYKDKIKLLMDFAKNHKAAEVPDPYYSGPEVFEQVLDYCEDACLGLITTLVPQRV